MDYRKEQKILDGIFSELAMEPRFEDSKPLGLIAGYNERHGVGAVNGFLKRLYDNTLCDEDRMRIQEAYFPIKLDRRQLGIATGMAFLALKELSLSGWNQYQANRVQNGAAQQDFQKRSNTRAIAGGVAVCTSAIFYSKALKKKELEETHITNSQEFKQEVAQLVTDITPIIDAAADKLIHDHGLIQSSRP